MVKSNFYSKLFFGLLNICFLGRALVLKAVQEKCDAALKRKCDKCSAEKKKSTRRINAPPTFLLTSSPAKKWIEEQNEKRKLRNRETKQSVQINLHDFISDPEAELEEPPKKKRASGKSLAQNEVQPIDASKRSQND